MNTNAKNTKQTILLSQKKDLFHLHISIYVWDDKMNSSLTTIKTHKH